MYLFLKRFFKLITFTSFVSVYFTFDCLKYLILYSKCSKCIYVVVVVVLDELSVQGVETETSGFVVFCGDEVVIGCLVDGWFDLILLKC